MSGLSGFLALLTVSHHLTLLARNRHIPTLTHTVTELSHQQITQDMEALAFIFFVKSGAYTANNKNNKNFLVFSP
jgi:hypothetical protein